jgi:hypothetical protein
VGDNIVVMGHGRVGESGLMLAVRHTLFTEYVIPSSMTFIGYVAIAPSLYLTTVISSLSSISTNISTLLMASSDDCRYPAASHAMRVYANIQVGVCRTYIEMVGGLSCYYMNNNDALTLTTRTSCTSQEVVCGADATLAPSSQRSLANA